MRFHPLVDRWFTDRFQTPTEPQLRGWPAIQRGEDTLIAAPTGSGKTLAAFLVTLDGLVQRSLAGTLEDRTYVVYVSPLKALGNDVRKNLEQPLAELRERAALEGLSLGDIRTAVRTGDTPAKDRARMVKRPPHVLITTPESLYILLTSESGRRMLGGVETVIVDEIHAIAKDKRGAHLALSLERLERLVGRRLQRIGLSATQKPIAEIARFLVGGARVEADGTPRCHVVDEGHRRAMDLGIEVLDQELSSVAAKEQWAEVYDRVAKLIREHRTTLVFVNTRRMVERAAHALAERLGEDEVAAHHGSLSRAARLRAEEQLKQGALKAVVATASLELGIDVGAVDLVCQLGSVRSFAVGLQRVGRAGHWRGAVPKGRFFPATRDELVEACAFIRGVRRGELEQTRIPAWPRDVLAQQLVAMAACEDLDEPALHDLVTRAWPYKDLPREELHALLEMLSDGISARRGRAHAMLHRDQVNGVVKGRRAARLTAITNGGAIPETGQYQVVAEPEGVQVGTLDEDFAVESLAGDVFLLGNTSWRIRRVEAGVVRVEDAGGAPPSIPFWNGEAPGRSLELASEVSRLRADLEPLLDDAVRAIAWLKDETGLPESGGSQLVAYLAACRKVLGALPTQQTLVAERFFDEGGGMQLIVHAPFGMRINRAYGLALRKCFCKTFDFELQAAASDDAVLLSLGPQHSFPLEDVFEFVSPRALTETLTQAALRAPMFGIRWRWNATRALAVPRRSGSRKVPPPIQRMLSDDLLTAVFPQQTGCQENVTGPLEAPDHPLVNETLRDCLTEAMDIDGLRALLERMGRGELKLLARELPEPSPLSHEILHGAPYTYLDDAPLEERRARAVATRRTLSGDERELGALDAGAIEAVAAEAWPVVRDADELHDALLGLVFVADPELDDVWRPWLEELKASGRVVRLEADAIEGFAPTERAYVACAALGVALPDAAKRFEKATDRDAAQVELVRGHCQIRGPFTARALARVLGLSAGEVDIALASLESEGIVLRGRFTPAGGASVPAGGAGVPAGGAGVSAGGAGVPAGGPQPEWCERGLLARIHRRTLARLRREIEPVSAADYLRFLFRWQHATEALALHGRGGLLEVVGQLQGFQAAAAAWEQQLFPQRVARYAPSLLDELCLSGEVVWGRFAPARSDTERAGRRAPPSRTALVSFARREDLPWLLAAMQGAEEPVGEAAARVEEVLRSRGALFLTELVQASRLPPPELEPLLWELVSAGRVSCDGFSGLRSLIAPAREADNRRATSRGGRWSLLPRAPVNEGERWPDGTLEAVAGQLARRYGVVFRELLARESLLIPWRELTRTFRRLEARGELRGGRFVSGFAGEQFASPGAVELLRAVRRDEARDERADVCGADPLNLVGILTPGPKIPAVVGNRVRYRGGVPFEALEPALSLVAN